MGEVFKAYDERLGRWVALKSVHLGRELDPERRDQLLREARAIAALSHPSIAQIHDITTIDGRDFLVLEYIEGINLAEAIRDKQIDLLTALRIGIDVAKGLYAAHMGGIVHRDLKAANIIVTPNGRAKVLDFGLAQVMRSRRGGPRDLRLGELAGTLSAMSPEQIDRAAVDHRSDLFSLGTMLYEMVTLKHPFRGPTPLDTIHRISCVDPEPPHRVNPEVPVAVSRLICRLLNKNASSRPKSAIEVIRVLEMECDPPGEQTDSYPAFRSRTRVLVLGAAAVIVLVASALLGLRLFGTEPQRPLRVAVLQPEIMNPEAGGRLLLVASALRTAMVGSLAKCPTLYSIDESETDSLTGRPSQVGTAVGADEVLVSEITRFDDLCQVRMSRVAPAHRNTIRMDFFAAPIDDLRLLVDMVVSRMRRIYMEHPLPEVLRSKLARSEDYETLLRLQAQLRRSPSELRLASELHLSMHPAWEPTLAEAADLRRRVPDLIDTYLLELTAASLRPGQPYGALKHAREVVDAAAQIDGADLRPTVLSIHQAMALGALDEAESMITEQETLHPNHPDIAQLRVRLAVLRGNIESALQGIESLIEDRPSWLFHLQAAELAISIARIDVARAHIEQGLERAPQSSELRAKQAELELLFGDVDKARALYLSMLKEQADPIPALRIGLANVQMLDGEYEDAAASLELIQGPWSKDPAGLLVMADCLDLAGHQDRAHAAYMRALESIEQAEHPEYDRSPHEPSLERLLGPATPLDPSAPSPRLLSSVSAEATRLKIKAQCLAHLGRGQEALVAIGEALRLAPASPQIHQAAAVVNAVLGRSAAAEAEAKRCLDGGMSAAHLALPWFEGTGVADVVREHARQSQAPAAS